MTIKEQTRKLAAGCSKQCFEVVNRTDEVSNIYTVRRHLRSLKRFSKSISLKKRKQTLTIGLKQNMLSSSITCPHSHL